ncbi:hypothetical protein H9Q70_014704, partial [Fusarium xylarioides]
LEQVNEAEMPKELVDVRTIDESPSFEADVVFACLVRTGKRIGHINDDKRLNVCMSRAKVGAALRDQVQRVLKKTEPQPL